MVDNHPMKGFHGMLNQELLDFFWDVRKEVDDVYTDAEAEENPDAIIDALCQLPGWIHEKDRFGNKAYRTTTYPASVPPLNTDELRITVVHPSGKRSGALYLDVRAWGQYAEGFNQR
jgi:hypothetical protein